MGPVRPSAYPDWATNPPSGAILPPPTPEVESGWAEDEAPAAEWMNYLQNLYGQWIRWFDNEINFAQSDANVIASTRLINGGYLFWTVSSSRFEWSMPLNLRIPSIPDAYNQLAAGFVNLLDGQSMYVIANIPLNTTANTQNTSNILQNVAFEEGIAIGQTISGVGIQVGTTVVDFDEESQTVTMSLPATANGVDVGVTFSGTGPLTAVVANSSAIVPSPNLYVLATRVGNYVFVGANCSQMFLKDNDSRTFVTDYRGYDAVTGTSPTASDGNLAAALSRLATAGGKILVAQNENVSSPIGVTFDNFTIEFAPGVTFQPASAYASSAFDISGKYCRVKNARFANFLTYAINYMLGADYGSVFDSRFKNCTDEINDQTATENIQQIGNTTEA